MHRGCALLVVIKTFTGKKTFTTHYIFYEHYQYLNKVVHSGIILERIVKIQGYIRAPWVLFVPFTGRPKI